MVGVPPCFSKQSRMPANSGGEPAGGSFDGGGTVWSQTVAGSVSAWPAGAAGAAGAACWGSGAGADTTDWSAAKATALGAPASAARTNSKYRIAWGACRRHGEGPSAPAPQLAEADGPAWPSPGQAMSLLDLRRVRPE